MTRERFNQERIQNLLSLCLSHTHTHTHTKNRSDVDWLREVKCEDHEDCATCTSAKPAVGTRPRTGARKVADVWSPRPSFRFSVHP